jgi:hypothetical protein
MSRPARRPLGRGAPADDAPPSIGDGGRRLRSCSRWRWPVPFWRSSVSPATATVARRRRSRAKPHGTTSRPRPRRVRVAAPRPPVRAHLASRTARVVAGRQRLPGRTGWG